MSYFTLCLISGILDVFQIAVSIELVLIHASNRKLHERPKCSGDQLMCLISCGNEGHILISNCNTLVCT